MAADVVNLRLARKRRDRQVREDGAAANRAAHGIAKGARSAAAAERQREATLLDGHRRTLDDPAPQAPPSSREP